MGRVVAQDAPHVQSEFVNGAEAVAGEVLVELRSNNAAAITAVSGAALADRNDPLGATGWRRVHSATHAAQTLLQILGRHRDVLRVEPNYIVHATTIPSDPRFAELWGLRNGTTPGADIHASSAWSVSTGSTSTVVGVVDTGIDYNHPDLAPNLWSAPSQFTVTVGGKQVTCPMGSHGFNAINFAQHPDQPATWCNPMDDAGHGTHVAGTIGAIGNNSVGVTGINWTTRIMAMKFLDQTGSGSIGDAVNAIEFAIQTKNVFAASRGADVRVLSNSWGGPGADALLNEVTRTRDANILFVAAAGNSATNNDAAAFFPASYTVDNIIAVAATDSTDKLASFSNYGVNSVDLAAPGVGILSTMPNNAYGYLSGTSMATPHVSGAATLLLSRCNLTYSELRSTILRTVDVLPGLSGMVASGGRLNADAAIRSCAPATSPTGATATFLGLDTATQGTWRTVYGLDGYNVIADAQSYPAYAVVTAGGQAGYTWAASTTATRALQKATNPADRLAATWYAGTSFTLDVSLIDGGTHQVALYLLDWDTIDRSETITVRDVATNAVLDSRTISGFNAGTYARWTLSGHVVIEVTRAAGLNAVVAGLFFDPSSAGGRPASATFLGTDPTTQGTWRGVYGTGGYGIVGDSQSYPAYAVVTPSGQASYEWANSTSDVRALQRAVGSDRVASTWYNNVFTIDVNITDGLQHDIALYVLDWDTTTRVETIEVRDAQSKALLDSRVVTGFNGGQYLKWAMIGHVTFTVTRNAGMNAVVAGIFFDR